MIKAILPIIFTLFAAPQVSFAAKDGVTACDEQGRKNIDSRKDAETLFNVIRNLKGEIVGALTSSKDGKLDALYLCGQNYGYYYANGNVSDIKDEVLNAFNDEYDVGIKSAEYDKATETTTFKVDIKFNGDASDADYQEIKTTLVIDTKSVPEVPW